MFYTIYKITNWYNGKIYIGGHKTKNLNDGYMGSGKVIKRAIAKHGIQYFTKEYLYIFDNSKSMYDMESELVNEAFISREDTYNLKIGGCGGFEYINNNKLNLYGTNGNKYSLHIKHREKLKSDKTYKLNFGSKISKSLKMKYLSGFRSPFYGKRHNKETLACMSDRKIGKNTGDCNPQYGKIRCVKIDAESCISHFGFFPDDIPNGFISTKEWKDRKKKKEASDRVSQRLGKIDKAYCWYDEYLCSGAKSLRDFTRIKHYPYSHVNLFKMFKKYIDEY